MMGLLNHLFGSKTKARVKTARKLVMDDARRLQLWQTHLVNYLQREQLSKYFSFKNIDVALADFNKTKNILIQIELLILPELITVTSEQKNEAEVMIDLQRLRDVPGIQALVHTLVYDRKKHLTLPLLFTEIHNLLLTELHLLRLIQQKPANLKNLLLQLFELIFTREAFLYKPFREDSYLQENKATHAEIMALARAALLEQELQEKIESAEEVFAREIGGKMASGESKRSYRKLAEDIYGVLAEKAGAPVSRGEDISEAIARMEADIGNDVLMRSIIKKLRPKYDKIKIKGVILAFRTAYQWGHFEELAGMFAT